MGRELMTGRLIGRLIGRACEMGRAVATGVPRGGRIPLLPLYGERPAP